MSVENNVFLKRERMPTPELWANAIAEHGFAMEMDSDFEVSDFEGFLPCKYKGEGAGFEYWAEATDLDQLVEEGLLSDEERAQLGDCDFLVTLVTRSDFRELATSMIAAAVLAELTGGLFAEGGEPPFVLGEDSVGWVKDLLPEIEREFE
ncbi:MAG: hypothetical protein AAF662_01580 [Pseudomonadota bacterium]